MGRDARGLGGAWTKYQRHAFPSPSPDLAPYVARYWVVSWEYDEPYRQLIVPYPNVHLTFQGGGATVNGVSSGHQVKVLEGRDGVFGVAFRPGAFRPFLGASVSTITDRRVDAAEVFPGPLPAEPDVPGVEAFLLAHLPEPDPRAQYATDVVEKIIAGPEITRVDVLAGNLGTSVRALQRLFAEHVGIGPKWVIRRYRLHEVTERLERGEPIDWAVLAADLGYSDQAHFVRDFRAMFGEPPTRYAQRY
ncbi:helix-turn-helix domain-containing protein [Allokutzneria sp. A3M-2-11 16]|uniref:helix-turn-helix domain-containing protein n=1 Tax=Allokutzneria sp. A3M-2-11 16 TaxID=2962043 RepID=UPI0020B686C2|nr:helix-turn-helix domain-containing protein [Allokutzneria sp. A3M-2-11 16]MCP3804033.1 helix-turn-helix domain-containing protein [Allokutzneria sp. A3M-2-11 16]